LLRRSSGGADDHHEQLMGADQCDRRPRGHRGTRQAIAQAVCHVGRKRCGDPSLSSHLARAGTGAFRRAESSVTIEVA
jgi:hypothetical protein